MGYVLKILRQLRSSKIYPEGTVSSVLNMSKKQNVFFFFFTMKDTLVVLISSV